MAPNVLDTVLLPQPGKPAIVDGRPRCSQTDVTLKPDYMQFISRILLPLPFAPGTATGEVLGLLVDANAHSRSREPIKERHAR